MNNQENVLPIEGSGRVILHQDGRLGSILVENGKIDSSDVEPILEVQRVRGLRFGEAALSLRLITRDDLRGAVAKQYGLPHLLPGGESINSELVGAYEPFHPRAEEMRALRTQLLIRWSNAQVRHSVVTGQRLQTSFASAICARAGPLFPTGKNSSGSSSRQTALWLQSIGPTLLTVCAAGRTSLSSAVNACTRNVSALLHPMLSQAEQMSILVS